MHDAMTLVREPRVSYITLHCIQNWIVDKFMFRVTNHLLLAPYLVENAKIFKEELLKKNVKNSNALNLQTLRLGINSIIALSNSI